MGIEFAESISNLQTVEIRQAPGFREDPEMTLPAIPTLQGQGQRAIFVEHMGAVAEILNQENFAAANIMLTAENIQKLAGLKLESKLMILGDLPVTGEKLHEYLGQIEETLRGSPKTVSVDLHSSVNTMDVTENQRFKMNDLLQGLAIMNLEQWFKAYHDATGTTICRDAALLPKGIAYETDFVLFLREKRIAPSMSLMSKHTNDEGLQLLNEQRNLTRQVEAKMQSETKNVFTLARAGKEPPDIAINHENVSRQQMVIERLDNHKFLIKNGNTGITNNFYMNSTNRWSKVPESGVTLPGGSTISIGHYAKFSLPVWGTPPSELPTEVMRPEDAETEIISLRDKK